MNPTEGSLTVRRTEGVLFHQKNECGISRTRIIGEKTHYFCLLLTNSD